MLYRIQKETKGKKEIYNLIEVRSNEVVFESERRADVINQKGKLEGWKNKQKRKWNGD